MIDVHTLLQGSTLGVVCVRQSSLVPNVEPEVVCVRLMYLVPNVEP
jgi:hypothetical protein